MFDNLTSRLSGIAKRIRGQARLTEDNVGDTLREVRTALLEADVALPVVREFIERIRARALGQEVIGTLTPGQALIRVVRDELTALMGESEAPLNLKAEPPAVILLAGLQGSGKTTSAAKLARFLKEAAGKKVLLASCDIYRPAAIEQLRVLAGEIEVDFHGADEQQNVETIALESLKRARSKFVDVLIMDTAGRLHIDEQMMAEIRQLHALLHPVETLFIVDAMMGQDAVNTARAFNETIPISGIILTKADGDSRGGAALSVRHVTGKPIKFVGVGEKTAALEAFYPDRMASRILGMGDVLGLIEEVEKKVDREKATALAKKISKGKGFDLQDFRNQLTEMGNLGGFGSVMEKLPGFADLPPQLAERVNDGEFVKFAAIIDSMTPHERRFPAVIKASRKRRIAGGSGTEVQDVNRLLKQFGQMQKMMKRMGKKGGLQKMMRAMKGGASANLPF